jgi:hypothetical protein
MSRRASCEYNASVVAALSISTVVSSTAVAAQPEVKTEHGSRRHPAGGGHLDSIVGAEPARTS